MKPLPFLLFYLIILSAVSCSRDFFVNEAQDCIDHLEVPFSNTGNESGPYLKGKMKEDSLSIYDIEGDYHFSLQNVAMFYSLPGQWINPSDTAQASGIGLAFVFTQLNENSFFLLSTPAYDKKTGILEIIDEIGKQTFLAVEDGKSDYQKGYAFQWLYKCTSEDDSFLSLETSYPLGTIHYNDQYGKAIKVKKFEKKRVSDFWHYEIIFEIDVNLFSKMGYYGEFKSIYKTNFSLPATT